MSLEENKKKLDDLTKRRDTCKAKMERAKGRLDSARRELDSVVAECRKKGVEPDQIPDALSKLQDKFASLVVDLERRVEDAERSIIPYLEEK
jgi:predicted nuclease with TOPRIM domain